MALSWDPLQKLSQGTSGDDQDSASSSPKSLVFRALKLDPNDSSGLPLNQPLSPKAVANVCASTYKTVKDDPCDVLPRSDMN